MAATREPIGTPAVAAPPATAVTVRFSSINKPKPVAVLGMRKVCCRTLSVSLSVSLCIPLRRFISPPDTTDGGKGLAAGARNCDTENDPMKSGVGAAVAAGIPTSAYDASVAGATDRLLCWRRSDSLTNPCGRFDCVCPLIGSTQYSRPDKTDTRDSHPCGSLGMAGDGVGFAGGNPRPTSCSGSRFVLDPPSVWDTGTGGGP